MIRNIGIGVTIALLAGCSGDGRGSQYSSARAKTSPVTYVPITPGAVPIQGGSTGARVVTTAALQPTPAPVVRFSTGPIYSACLNAGRNGATQSRCGCVQWVADRQLNATQQRRGAEYFTKQDDLQEVRQSDRDSNEEFWEAWTAFGNTAGKTCSSA